MPEEKSDFDEEIENLANLVRLAETTTALDQYLKNKISKDAAICKIYLRNTEKK
jgi:hypothetical protein